MALATSSLPVPDSPRISTVVGVAATRTISSASSFIFGFWPMMKSPSACAWISRSIIPYRSSSSSDLGAARDVDDEVHRGVSHERPELGGHGDIEAPGQLEAGRPRVEIGAPEDGDGGIADEHLEEGTAPFAGPDDDDFGHGRRPRPVRTAAAPGRAPPGSRRTRTRG